MTTLKARNSLQDIAPYQQGKSELNGNAEPIKLSSNESANGSSPNAVEAYKAANNTLHRYPDGAQQALRKAISEVHQLPFDQIVCGNGSEELIGLTIRSYVAPGDEVILTRNHFIMSRIHASAQGASVILAEECNNVADVDHILSAVSRKTRMVVLSNPNNPTGTYVKVGDIARLVEALPESVILILDGAYAEYVCEHDYEDGARYAIEKSNVVVTHTFSKIHGLAGARIGWAVAATGIIETINRIRTPFNANTPAMAAATAAMRDRAFVDNAREENRQALNRLLPTIRKLGFDVTDSVANFYLIDVTAVAGASANNAITFLEQKNIIVRPADDDDCVRITVGTSIENDLVIDALSEYRGSLS